MKVQLTSYGLRKWIKGHPVYVTLIGGFSIAYLFYEMGAFMMDARSVFEFLSANADKIYQFSQTPLFSWALPFLVVGVCGALIFAASRADERRHKQSEAIKLEMFHEIKSNNKTVALLISEGELLKELDELKSRFFKDRAALSKCLNEIQDTSHVALGVSRQQAKVIISDLSRLSLIKEVRHYSMNDIDPEGFGFSRWKFEDSADQNAAYSAFANAAASIAKIQSTIQDVQNELGRIRHERSDSVGEKSHLIGISRYGLAEYEPSFRSDYDQEILLKAKHGKDANSF